MPRIDPIQLLKCLSVLLSPNGGIKSRDEVHRLASLMTKFSKKLVSKCIYIQILKCTETELLGLFMGSGGWRLVHMWLTESIVSKNWPLVRELLELLLLCPVDIERLKTNNCPKLVKELSKDENYIAIRALASKLVEQWLKTVKGEQVTPMLINDIPKVISNAENETVCINKQEVGDSYDKLTNSLESKLSLQNDDKNNEVKTATILDEKRKEPDGPALNEKELETLPVLKITLKDGKQIISQVEESDNKENSKSNSSPKEKSSSSSKHKSKSKERSSDSKSKSSSKYSNKSSSSSSSDKHKSRHSSKDRSKDKSKHSSSSKSSDRRSSDSSSSSKHRSSKSKDESSKDKIRERDKKDKDEKNSKSDKDSYKNNESEKPLQPSIHKLGKIPKLSESKKEKPSISIEVRKPDDPKPKTVKTFNSKFRKHGLEEEVKPPPSRATVLNKKVSSVTTPPTTVNLPKRPSPVRNEPPPEKKPKIESIEKPGAIKLIPAKPKPMMLLESDMFMDALNASATNKKEPKKRKRRTSGSKDGNPSDSSPPHTPTNSASSPSHENKSVPLKFYQDTLDTEEEKEKHPDKSENNLGTSESTSPTNDTPPKEEEQMEVNEPVTLTVNGLKGVLCYHKKKGPKKNIKWKIDLEEIQYFELDETERVNVTKTFTDMKYLDRIHEREAFEKARNLINDDVMEEKTIWKALIPIECDGQINVEYGKNSKERDIQAIRQKGTLQPLYFHKSMIPDTPFEADNETHPYSEPAIIPLDDVTGNQDNITDFRNMPWPEPKGNTPVVATTNVNVPPMFQPPMGQFPNNFQNPPFGFQGPNIVPPEWQNGMPPPHMMGPGMVPGAPGPMLPGPIPPGVPPGLMIAPDNMILNPEMFNGPNPMFPPMAPDNFNMIESMNMPGNMFPPDFNMGQGLPGPDGPPVSNFRGGMRGRGSSGWRGKPNWEGPPRGRGGYSRGNRKAVCIYFQRKGSCRQGDNCSFLHQISNGPY